MKILIEIPFWLGDATMATPAIENIIKHFKGSEFVIFGSFVSTKIFKYHPIRPKIIIDDSKEYKFRYLRLYTLAKIIEDVDIFFSFRQSFSSKIFAFFINSKQKFKYKRDNNPRHLVIRYNDFINQSLNTNYPCGKLKIYKNKHKSFNKKNKLLGINPGATYGSAKRWYPSEFAKVANYIGYDVIIFGSKNEIDIAKEIEKDLKVSYKNLSGKTSVEELISYISELDLFITNDSGPMHIASAFMIPTIAIFGPTDDTETSAWNNNSIIVKKDYDCMPCKKRTCPLKIDNHKCMKNLKADEVIEKLKTFIK